MNENDAQEVGNSQDRQETPESYTLRVNPTAAVPDWCGSGRLG